jgi:hypothetical protein
MRTCLILICIFGTAICARGQKELRVIDWKSEQTVNTFLLSKMHEQFDSRRVRLRHALESPSLTLAYRDSCRARYRKLLGELPAKTSLNVQVTGKILQSGYHIERIIYESVPNHHVTANLYVPDGKGPFPGVLLFCGHEDEAKATESYQRTAILFALNKFVVLVIDPISQSERHQLTDAEGKPMTRGGTTEHTLINAAANLVGTGTVAFQLWDNIRGLDYLESRHDVDKNRIGCLGNSGGGTQTTYLIAYDDRIKVAAPCSFIASRERNFELTGAADGCQHIPYEGAAQLEISDLLIAFAPKPLLVLAGRYDFVDYYGTTMAFNEVSSVYRKINAGEKVKLFSVEDGHGISLPKRDAAVRWFKRWLYNDTTISKEINMSIASAESLRSSDDKSQVNTKFPGEINDFGRSMALAESYSHDREVGDLRVKVLRVSNLKFPVIPATREDRGTIDYKGMSIKKLLIRKEGQIPLPVLMLVPAGVVNEVVVWVHGKGKRALVDSTSLIQSYLRDNKILILADVSGVGELADLTIGNDPKYLNSEYRNAMLGLHVGYPMPSLRTRDILTLVDFIAMQPEWKGKPWIVYAHGVCSLPALQAAVLDDRITKVYSIGGITSFTDVIGKPLKGDWYSYVIPNVLQYYDVRDLTLSLKGRVVVTE